MLISELIDKTFMEWLYPAGDDQPAYDFLLAEINATVLALTLEGRTNRVARSSILEIDSEVILTKDVSGPAVTIADRGFLNTTPGSHNIGALVKIDPTFTRKACLDAARAIIANLYPWGVYQRAIDTAQTYQTTGVFALPTGGREVLSILVRRSTDGEQWDRLKHPGEDWVMYTEFDPGKYQMRARGITGAQMLVVYMKDWAIPSVETDELNTLGLPTALQEGLSMGVAGWVLRGREIPRVLADRIRELLSTQGVQVGASLNIGNALLDLFKREFVTTERRRLSELDPPGFEYVGR